MSKKNKAKRPAISPSLRSIIGGAASVGYDVATGFAGGVTLAKACAKNRAALVEAGIAYRCGYIVRYLEDVPGYLRRVGNMDRQARFDDAALIMAKPGVDTAKPNRRTAIEHSACRAADTSWSNAKRRAGIVATKAGGRKPRTSSNAPSKAVPVDLVKASPKLANKAAANDYFATAAAALLATVDKNAARVMPQISSAVSDFHSAIKALGLIGK